MNPEDLPDYDQLPLHNGERVTWGLFDNDEIGTANFLTAEKVVAAARLIRSGRVFPLDRGPCGMGAGMFGRTPPRHRVFETGGGRSLDDVLDNFYPQGSSQWDSLSHVQAFPGEFHGQRSRSDIASGHLTIDHLAAHGVVGRVAVVDIETIMRERDPGYDSSTSTVVTADVIQEACRTQAVDVVPGDVLLLHMGWEPEGAAPGGARSTSQVTAVGLEQSEQVAAYLWNLRPSAIVTDCPALEAWPPSSETRFGFLHSTIIGRLGIHIGELWWTSDLIAHCRADQRYEAFLASAPMRMPGGVGSPANAIAIK